MWNSSGFGRRVCRIAGGSRRDAAVISLSTADFFFQSRILELLSPYISVFIRRNGWCAEQVDFLLIVSVFHNQNVAFDAWIFLPNRQGRQQSNRQPKNTSIDPPSCYLETESIRSSRILLQKAKWSVERKREACHAIILRKI